MNRLLIWILAALSMLGALSIDAYLPAIPTIGQQFDASLAAVQQSLTVYVLSFAIMTLFYGTLSDSFGRRPVILGSLVVYLLASVGAACSTSLGMLIFFRIWQGLSAGAGAVVGRAVVGDLASGAEAHRAMSYMSVVFGLAPAIAPILGGWLLASLGWRSIFWFITTFTALLLLVCFTSLPESLPAGKRQPFHLVTILKSYLEVGSRMRFMLRSASIALAFSGIMIYVVAAPDFVINILHLEITDFGWLFLPLIGGMTAGSYLSGWLSHRVAGTRLIRYGFGLMAAAAAMNIAYNAFFPAKIPWAVIPIFCYAFGICLAMPGMTVITLEMFPSMRGLAASMQTFFFMLMFSLLSGLIAPLVYGFPLHFALLSVIGSILGISCWLLANLAPE